MVQLKSFFNHYKIVSRDLEAILLDFLVGNWPHYRGMKRVGSFFLEVSFDSMLKILRPNLTFVRNCRGRGDWGSHPFCIYLSNICKYLCNAKAQNHIGNTISNLISFYIFLAILINLK